MPPRPNRPFTVCRRGDYHRITVSSGIALATALLACTLTAPACHRKKPNANDDLRKSRESIMQKMDRIAAEEAAKHPAPADTPTPPPAKDVQPAPAKPDSAKPPTNPPAPPPP